MTGTHKILMGWAPTPERINFYEALVPPEFELVWVENRDDTEAVAVAVRDVEFAFMSMPPISWLPMMPRLKLVQQGGVGYRDEHVQAASEHGVSYAVTPEGTSEGVAEHTLMLILALYKHLAEAHQSLTAGDWDVKHRLRMECRLLYGKVLGIVGLGRAGQEVVQRAKGFEPQKIVYYDIFRKSPEEESALGVEFLPLDDLLRRADIVSLHVFLSDRSRGMIGERELGLMKSDAILINTSRGAVVDEGALYRALRDRRIWGAGLDVWAQEPTPPDNPILQLDNVICTPHMSAGSSDGDRIRFETAIANFRRVLRGEEPLNVVRPYTEQLAEIAR